MPIEITQICVGAYAPLTFNGSTQSGWTGYNPMPLYTTSGSGPQPPVGPVLLPTDAEAPGQLLIEVSFPEGVRESAGSFMMVTAVWNGLPFVCRWGPFEGTSQLIYSVTFVLTPSAPLAGRPYYALMGPLAISVYLGNGAITDTALGTFSFQIYTGPNPNAPSSQGTDIRALQQWVARDMAGQLTPPTCSAQEVAGACAQAAFQSPPAYATDNCYFTYPEAQPTLNAGNFALEAWLLANTGLNPGSLPANCYDSTAMCCLMQALAPPSAILRAWGGDIRPFGSLISPTTQVIRGKLNNPPPPYTPFYTFGDHMVMVVDWGASDYYVADGCFGPHLATETCSQYLQNTLKDPSYPQSAWDEPPPTGYSGTSFYLPTLVDSEAFPESSPTLIATPQRFLANRDAFAAAMGLATAPPAEGAAPVKGAPAFPGDCPALGPGFKLVHQQRSYAWPTAQGHWVLSDGAATVRLTAWICSDGPAPAHLRFLHEGAATHGEVEFTKAAGPGDACAVREAEGKVVEVLWLSGARVFRLQANDARADLMAVAAWIEAAPAGTAAPVIRSARVSTGLVAVGGEVAVEVSADGSYPLEIFGVRRWLRLVKGDGRVLTLVAEHPGRAEAMAVVTDPETLLSAAAPVTIEVTPAE